MNFYFKIITKLIIVVTIWVLGVIANDSFGMGFVELFSFLIGLSFIPMIVLYLYRRIRNLQVKSLNKTFRFLCWINLLLFSFLFAVEFYYGVFFWDFYDWVDVGITIIESWPNILIILLLFVLLKINSTFINKNEQKDNTIIYFIKTNKATSIALLTIIITFLMSAVVYNDARNVVDSTYDWYFGTGKVPEVYVRDTYNLAFMKIAIFGSFILASGFLLIYAMKKNNTEESDGFGPEYDDDVLLEEAKKIVIKEQVASATLLQRKLIVGYARAARLLDLLEDAGVVGPAEGSTSRKIYK